MRGRSGCRGLSVHPDRVFDLVKLLNKPGSFGRRSVGIGDQLADLFVVALKSLHNCWNLHRLSLGVAERVAFPKEGFDAWSVQPQFQETLVRCAGAQ